MWSKYLIVYAASQTKCFYAIESTKVGEEKRLIDGVSERRKIFDALLQMTPTLFQQIGNCVRWKSLVRRQLSCQRRGLKAKKGCRFPLTIKSYQ